MPVDPLPCLLVMKGFPATGKSALAQALALRLHWPLVDKDDIKDVILPCPDGNALAYDVMWAIAARQLQLGLSVIVDSPLTYPQAFAAALDLAERAPARLLVVETRLAQDIWQQRLAKRDARASAHKIAGWRAMQELLVTYNDCWRYPIPPASHLPLDSSLPISVLVERVLAHLAQIADVRTSKAIYD